MISDILIEHIETLLRASHGTNHAAIVPIDSAFPTSGHSFIRIIGSRTDKEFHETSVVFQVFFEVHCSIRSRH